MTLKDLLDEVDETHGVIVTDYDLIDKELKGLGVSRQHDLEQVHQILGEDAEGIIYLLDGCGLIVTDEETFQDYIERDPAGR